MTTIWKYDFQIKDGEQRQSIPRDAQVLTVAEQNGLLCAWALVVPGRQLEQRVFRIHGTGHPVDPNDIYLGTAHIAPFVWHLFEVRKDD